MLSFSLFAVTLASIPFVAISCGKTSYKDQVKDRMQKLIDKYKDDKSKSSILNTSLSPLVQKISEISKFKDLTYKSYKNIMAMLDTLEKSIDSTGV
ncbi:variable surface lipoprotein [Mycoplasma zalophi]|uniref:variable surface lipoprotein n=1 Tax=Mycoplasma zalophi TaxID=191287 RepID=UPI0021C8AD30|nr:variable surface lipoprotein [Mycoplasma zalophi]MCU4116915.1 variable surface lipoprotein [Mycoplasma zalophi]